LFEVKQFCELGMRLFFILIAFAVLLLSIDPVGCDERATTLSVQTSIYQKLKQKHNPSKLNLTRTKRVKGGTRSRIPSFNSNSKEGTTKRPPRLHFRRYDQMMSTNDSRSMHVRWNPPPQSRPWLADHQFQHKWTRVSSVTSVEYLYAPIEIGHGYSIFNQTAYSFVGNNKTVPTVSDGGGSGMREGMWGHSKDGLWTIQKSRVDLRAFPQCQLGSYKENGYISQQRQSLPKCIVRK
jgi:hypothetical protein